MFSIIASENHSRNMFRNICFTFRSTRRWCHFFITRYTSLFRRFFFHFSFDVDGSSFEFEKDPNDLRESLGRNIFSKVRATDMFRWKLASKQKSRERREFRPALKDSVDSTSPKKINSGSQPDGKSQFSPLSRAVDLNRIIRRCVVTFISPSFLTFFLSFFLSFFLLYRRVRKKK